MKKILITILCCFIMLPAYAGFKKVMSKCMNSWLGYTTNEIIKVWGYPTNQKEFAGKKLLYWEDEQSYIYGNQYGIYGGTNTCTRILEINDSNEIIGWEVKGNNCPGTYCRAKKWVNPDNDPWKIEKEQKKYLKQQKRMMKNEIDN